MKFKILFLALFAALAVSACDKKDEPVNTPAAQTPAVTEEVVAVVEPTATEQTEAAPAAESQPVAEEAEVATVEVSEPAAVASDLTGIPECDEYLTKVMACYEGKIPEAQRAAMIDSLNQMKSQWASVPAGQKDMIASSCKQALDAQRQALKSAYGCDL